LYENKRHLIHTFWDTILLSAPDGNGKPTGAKAGMHGAAELTAGRYRCNDAARA